MPNTSFTPTQQSLTCQSVADLTSRPTNALASGDEATVPSAVPPALDVWQLNKTSLDAFSATVIGTDKNADPLVPGRWIRRFVNVG